MKAEREIPCSDFYGDFDQLDNGVGMWALFRKEANDALKICDAHYDGKKRTAVTGVAAFPLISETVEAIKERYSNLNCTVRQIKNDFFGDKITVAGLVTGSDIINQLKGEDLGEELLIPALMLRHENDMFLDNVTVEELEKSLGVRVIVTENDGYMFVDKILGNEAE